MPTKTESAENQELAEVTETEEKPHPPSGEGVPPTESEGVASADKKHKGCNQKEILAVLAHELGHWKLSHNLKNLTIGEVRLACCK